MVIVEHKNGQYAAHTLNTISAAQHLKGPVTALLAGGNKEQLNAVAKSLAAVPSVSKVLVAASPLLQHDLPETTGPVIANALKSGKFSHAIAPHSAFGKNVMPRVAALLDVAQISDVMKIDDSESFTRPFYAGMKEFSSKFR